jgi:hypothetical protein
LTGVLSAGTSSVTSSTVSGNGTIGGTLGVTGATTLSSTSAHGGAATFSSTVNVTGATSLTTLTASGTSTLTTLTTTGAASVGGTLGVTGATSLSSLTASGTSTLTALTTTGAATFSSTVRIPTGAGLNRILTSDANGNATWQTGLTTITTKSDSYTITNTDNFIIYTTAGVTGKTFTLPTASAAGQGKEFNIKNMSGFSLTVTSTSVFMQEYIASGTYPTSITVGFDSSNNWVKLVSDGTNWIVFRALF